jgi:UDP-glucose 4-epimerase
MKNDLFGICTFEKQASPKCIQNFSPFNKDILDVDPFNSNVVDVQFHLNALQNYPLEYINSSVTFQINYDLARTAKIAKVGVQQFLFSSSCCIYRTSSLGAINKEYALNYITTEGISKIQDEKGVPNLTDTNNSLFSEEQFLGECQ